ncbi:MAG: hypothetical protein HUJ96_03205 [Marinilabiliaceae bacterium]|nr:hypothetical protein [Marinilabiliaceae bacterium]
MKSFILILLTAILLLSSNDLRAQKEYEVIYDNLSNLSQDQAYSKFLNYQSKYPYFPNVYLQLGVISELKMINTDPLRDIEHTQYWANNAKLFFGNFKGFYKENDARHSDFYDNLRIQAANPDKITDEEVMAFADKHMTLCRNFADSTLLVYKALEASKNAYNRCVVNYQQICDDYEDINQMVLKYDNNLKERLQRLENDIDECIKQFAEYKRLLKLRPILNYRQVYDMKDIQIFRLDGLTNCDFLNNRFVIWDYKSWVAEVNKRVSEEIIPLRKRVEQLNAQFEAGLKEYRQEVKPQVLAQPVVDDKFVFQLGHYDNNSLVRDLFSYLEVRRNFMLMAADSLALATDSLPSMMNRRMRHIYRMTNCFKECRSKLDVVRNMVTEKKVARFKDFFQNNYGGFNGMTNYYQKESDLLIGVMNRTLRNFAKYIANVHERQQLPIYSVSNSNGQVPLFIITDSTNLADIKGQYITKHLARDVYGNVMYVAGDRKLAGKQQPFVSSLDSKGSVRWISMIPEAHSVSAVALCGNGCMVLTNQNGSPIANIYNDKGKVSSYFNAPEGKLDAFVHNNITGNSIAAFTSSASEVTVVAVDSLCSQSLRVKLPEIDCVKSIQEVNGDYMIVGQSKGKAYVMLLNAKCEIKQMKNISEEIVCVDEVFKASAQEICIYASDKVGMHYLFIISDKLEINTSI